METVYTGVYSQMTLQYFAELYYRYLLSSMVHIQLSPLQQEMSLLNVQLLTLPKQRLFWIQWWVMLYFTFTGEHVLEFKWSLSLLYWGICCLYFQVTMFSEYCENKFEVEPVEVVHHDGSKTVYPDLSCYKMEAPLSDILGPIGISLDEKQVLISSWKISQGHVHIWIKNCIIFLS